jgi:phage replication initiation protein
MQALKTPKQRAGELADYGVRWELELKKDRAEQCARALDSLDEADWKELVLGLLRSYVDFRQITKETEDEDRYWAPMLKWCALLTEGFQKGRLANGKEVQTLQNVKRWVSDTLTPMLAVICATPGGEEWLQHEIVRSISRWKDRHRNLLNSHPLGFTRRLPAAHAGSPG